MKDLSSYVPEVFHTHQKRQKPSRLFLEDLAVVEPENAFRILASRGADLPLGADFLKTCGVLSKDSALLHSLSPKQTRVLLPCKKGCVLMLGDLLARTGLFLGILLPRDADEVHCALLRMGQKDFLVPSRLLPRDGLLSKPYDEGLCDGLEELFYYLERILRPAPEASLWTRCLLIANFTGCRLERVALPVEAPMLSETDDACMTMFFLCSFLTLRQKNGRVQTETELDQIHEERVNYQCTVSFFEETDEPEAPVEPEELEEVEPPLPPLFLEHNGFSGLSWIPTEDGLILKTRFSALSKDPALGSLGESRFVCLRFLLSRPPYVEKRA